MRRIIGLLVVLTSLQGMARADEPPPEVGIVEKLGQTLPLDGEFYDEDGHLLTLRSLVTRPTIFTFVYFRCPGICSPLLTEVTRVIEKLDLEAGKDYQIITLSFDHRETPDLAKGKKENYLSALRKQVNPAGWRFLTGDSLSIRRLTDGAGFYFKRDREDWVHAGALVVVSPSGVVTRYINGISYLPFDVKMALIEASEGKVSPTIATMLKFCFSYDPEARTYALNVTRIAFVLVVLLVAVFVVVFLLMPRWKNQERRVRYGKTG